MATISLNIPDAALPRVVSALCSVYDYANKKFPGETQNQFAKRMVNAYIKEVVRNHEMHTAEASARATASSAVDSDIVLT